MSASRGTLEASSWRARGRAEASGWRAEASGWRAEVSGWRADVSGWRLRRFQGVDTCVSASRERRAGVHAGSKAL